VGMLEKQGTARGQLQLHPPPACWCLGWGSRVHGIASGTGGTMSTSCTEAALEARVQHVLKALSSYHDA
jgi:hypothetical protein